MVVAVVQTPNKLKITLPHPSVRRTRGRSGLQALVVILLDYEIEKALPPQIRGVTIKQLVEDIGAERPHIRLLTRLVARGVAVLMNSLDAVWIRDPIRNIFGRLGVTTDIAAQRSTTPVHLGRESANKLGKWGATVSAGFVYFHPSIATENFLASAAMLVPLESNVQKWLNEALDKMDVQWPSVKNGNKISIRSHTDRLEVGSVASERLEVALLPSKMSLGSCNASNLHLPSNRSAVLQHCRVAKPEDTISKLKQEHLWYLKEKWQVDAFQIAMRGSIPPGSAWLHVLGQATTVQMHAVHPLQPNSVMQKLVDRGREVAPGPLILVMASNEFLPTLLNFAERSGINSHYVKFRVSNTCCVYGTNTQRINPTPSHNSVRRTRGDVGLKELVVIMLDDQIEAALPTQIQGVRFKPLAKELNLDKQMWKRGRLDFNMLWNFRIKLLSILLEHKVKLLVNDLDAVWLQDPNGEIFAKLPANTDIIAQRASFPFSLGRDYASNPGEWGATICMGTHITHLMIHSLSYAPTRRAPDPPLPTSNSHIFAF